MKEFFVKRCRVAHPYFLVSCAWLALIVISEVTYTNPLWRDFSLLLKARQKGQKQGTRRGKREKKIAREGWRGRGREKEIFLTALLYRRRPGDIFWNYSHTLKYDWCTIFIHRKKRGRKEERKKKKKIMLRYT